METNLRVEELNNLRRSMGTLPDQNPPYTTPIYFGVKGISVKLIDKPVNPYKAMFTMATSCWGKKIDKWNDTEPSARVEVVKAVLNKSALPLAYEAPSFTFAFEDVSRWAFDQIVRARLGVVWSSMGIRDNNHLDAGVRVATEIWPTYEMGEKYHGMEAQEIIDDLYRYNRDNNILFDDATSILIDHIRSIIVAKEQYKRIIEKGKGSWQTARDVLPMATIHRFSGSMNFAAIQSICSKRMQFCEADQVVAWAYLLRDEIEKHFPLMAQFLRPGCDYAKTCTYHKAYSMSELFGCLFGTCGRWEDKSGYQYAEFNKSCTDKETIEKQLNFKIFGANEKLSKDFELTHIDKALFGFSDYHLPNDYYQV